MKSSELGKDVIRKELPLIPKSPGVYRMLNHKDDILYVGKAKNLPNRLKSYVSEKNHIIRTERMLSQTFKLEITTTANESEALLLEANLIKKSFNRRQRAVAVEQDGAHHRLISCFTVA